MSNSAAPAASFDWRKVNWGRPDSPPSALCSYCSASFGEDDVPVRLWTKAGFAAAFCEPCAELWLRAESAFRRASGEGPT